MPASHLCAPERSTALLQVSPSVLSAGNVMLQVGLNGVDNGSIRFSGVRVPRENLLDRFGSVDSSGQYRSPFSASRRFAATLGELTGGRVGLTCSSLGVLKVCFILVSCATRYYSTLSSMRVPVHAALSDHFWGLPVSMGKSCLAQY